jgi:hypothetical protein
LLRNCWERKRSAALRVLDAGETRKTGYKFHPSEVVKCRMTVRSRLGIRAAKRQAATEISRSDLAKNSVLGTEPFVEMCEDGGFE